MEFAQLMNTSNLFFTGLRKYKDWWRQQSCLAQVCNTFQHLFQAILAFLILNWTKRRLCAWGILRLNLQGCYYIPVHEQESRTPPDYTRHGDITFIQVVLNSYLYLLYVHILYYTDITLYVHFLFFTLFVSHLNSWHIYVKNSHAVAFFS